MNMLKHILAFLALILVSLAPVSADEGYITFLTFWNLMELGLEGLQR